MTGTICHYCGLPADSTDHVVPQSLLRAIRDSGDERLLREVSERRRKMTVTACRECNSLASAKYDDTLADRKRRVQLALRRKYKRVLAMPDWSHHELADMSELMQAWIIAGLLERDELRSRVSW